MPVNEERSRFSAHETDSELPARFRRNVFEKARAKCIVNRRLFVSGLNKIPFDIIEEFDNSGLIKSRVMFAKEITEFRANAVQRKRSIVLTVVVAFRLPLLVERWGQRYQFVK